MQKYMLKMPQTIYGGAQATQQLKQIAEMLNVKKAAIFTDQHIVAAGLTKSAESALDDSGVEVKLFDKVPAEPAYAQVQEMIDSFRSFKAELIVAVGGGSVMDTAKLASVLAFNEYTVKDLLDNPQYGQKTVKTVMIPTTAGTGAEATPNAIVAVPEKALKVGIVNDEMIADYVILDPEMIRRLPAKIAASTGADALCHAIECFTSKKANPFSDLFALQALDKILKNLYNAWSNPEAMDAREAMLTASFYAGVAITASGTTAVHALSYPLGGKYHIAHGVANAILLLPVLRFNAPACIERLAEAYMHIFPEQSVGLSTQQCADKLIDTIDALMKEIEIPQNLKSFGIGNDDLDGLVNAGMEVTRLLNNNPRKVNEDDARELYLAVM